MSTAADEGAVGVMSASASLVAEIDRELPVNRFVTEMLPSVREW